VTLPIIGCHYGYQSYLDIFVKEASKKNKVILIGDRKNQHLGNYPNVEHILFEEVSEDIDAFAKVYVHLNLSGLEYELFCYKRWIYCRNAVRKLGIERFFYSDSDNIIYSDLEKVYNSLGRPPFCLSEPEHQPTFRNSATGAVSYWSASMIEKFCEFMQTSYGDPEAFSPLLDKWLWHQSNKVPGGICDMTLLWHFVQKNPAFILTKTHPDDTTFDHNINSSENYLKNEYEMRGPIKNIVFRENVPYCKNLITGKMVRFHNLQFQGGSKSLMSHFVRG